MVWVVTRRAPGTPVSPDRVQDPCRARLEADSVRCRCDCVAIEFLPRFQFGLAVLATSELSNVKAAVDVQGISSAVRQVGRCQ